MAGTRRLIKFPENMPTRRRNRRQRAQVAPSRTSPASSQSVRDLSRGSNRRTSSADVPVIPPAAESVSISQSSPHGTGSRSRRTASQSSNVTRVGRRASSRSSSRSSVRSVSKRHRNVRTTRRVASFAPEEHAVAQRAAEKERTTGSRYRLLILSACDCDVQPRHDCPHVHYRRLSDPGSQDHVSSTPGEERDTPNSQHNIRMDCDYEYARNLFLDKIIGPQQKKRDERK